MQKHGSTVERHAVRIGPPRHSLAGQKVVHIENTDLTIKMYDVSLSEWNYQGSNSLLKLIINESLT